MLPLTFVMFYFLQLTDEHVTFLHDILTEKGKCGYSFSFYSFHNFFFRGLFYYCFMFYLDSITLNNGNKIMIPKNIKIIFQVSVKAFL